MHLEIRDGKEIVCQVPVPPVDRDLIIINAVIPAVRAFWMKTTGFIVVEHPNFRPRGLLFADPSHNKGIASRDFRARLTSDPRSEREKTLNIRAIIFD